MGAAKKTIYENAIGGSLIVNTGLVCARDGRVFERFKNLVCALANSGDEDVAINALRLFEVGETSGADMATGFYVSLVLLAEQGVARRLGGEALY